MGEDFEQGEFQTQHADADEEGAGSWEPDERSLSLEFRGDAREYFRVWIVNLCLTLLTFGVFSAWAKVRKKRYLYSHTFLDGSPFQYLGKPIPILRGRLVATLFVTIWYFVTHFEVQFIWPLLIAAAILVPWIIVRSAAFNARYSAFRNMTFHFSGSYGGFLSKVAGSALITLVSCGVGYAWLRASFNRYMISRTQYGGVAGEFRGTGKDFVRPYLVGGGLMLVIALCSMIIFRTGDPAHRHIVAKSIQQEFALIYAGYFLTFLYLKASVTNQLWNNTRLGGMRFESSLSFRRLLWIYVSNTLAIVASAGLLIPWAVVRVAKYRAAHFQVWTSRWLEEFEGSDSSTVRAAGAELGEFFDLDVAL